MTENEQKVPRKISPRGQAVNGTRLRELRESHYWNQADLAKRAKVSRATISRAEAGHQIGFPAIRALAKVLQVRVAEITASGSEADDDETHAA